MLNRAVGLFWGTLLIMSSAFAEKAFKAPSAIDDIPSSFSVPTTVMVRLDVIFKNHARDKNLVGDCSLNHMGYITEPSDGSQLGFKIEVTQPNSQKNIGFRILPTAQEFTSEKNEAGLTLLKIGYFTETLMGPQYHGIQIVYNNQNKIVSLEGFLGVYDHNGKLQSSDSIGCMGKL